MTQTRDRGAQVGQMLARRIERSGVGGLQQTRGQPGFRADDLDDLGQAHVGFCERLAYPHHYIGKARKIDRTLRYLACQLGEKR